MLGLASHVLTIGIQSRSFWPKKNANIFQYTPNSLKTQTQCLEFILSKLKYSLVFFFPTLFCLLCSPAVTQHYTSIANQHKGNIRSRIPSQRTFHVSERSSVVCCTFFFFLHLISRKQDKGYFPPRHVFFSNSYSKETFRVLGFVQQKSHNSLNRAVEQNPSFQQSLFLASMMKFSFLNFISFKIFYQETSETSLSNFPFKVNVIKKKNQTQPTLFQASCSQPVVHYSFGD